MYWICRAWTEKSGEGWTSDLVPFDTEEEAKTYGLAFIGAVGQDELSREYEVYKVPETKVVV